MTKQPVLLRTSERSVFRRCRLKWKWTYLDHYQPQREAAALSFGTLVHEALAEWYQPGKKRGTHPAEVFETLFDRQPINGTIYDDDGQRLDARNLGIQMLRGYVDRYGREKHIEIIAPEQAFAVDVCDENGKVLFCYVGKIDAVGRDRGNGRVFLFEHKTAKIIEFVHINSGYGEQALSYWWGGTQHLRHVGILGPKEEMQEVRFNFLRKGLPDPRPVNSAGFHLNKPAKPALLAALAAEGVEAKGTVEALQEMCVDLGIDVDQLGDVSKTQPSPLFARQELSFTDLEFRSFDERIRAEARDMKRVRRGKAFPYKNPTKDCSWDCPFKDPCEVHEMGGDYEGILELEYKQWSPYSDHAIANEKS